MRRVRNGRGEEIDRLGVEAVEDQHQAAHENRPDLEAAEGLLVDDLADRPLLRLTVHDRVSSGPECTP